MADQQFPAPMRLRRGAEFRRVFDQGRSAADGRMIVYAVDNDLLFSRLGLSVSRKIGGAVRRNRWKRMIREAFRLNRQELPAGLDLVAIPRGGEPTLADTAKSLLSLARQAQRRLKRPSDRERRPT